MLQTVLCLLLLALALNLRILPQHCLQQGNRSKVNAGPILLPVLFDLLIGLKTFLDHLKTDCRSRLILGFIREGSACIDLVKKYPKISESWRRNWPNLSTYFKFPEELRRLIYTTNAIEGFNRQLRKVTKAKSVFPTDDSLFKMLYLAMKDITKNWTGRRQDWSKIYAQIAIFYAERIPE